MFRVAVPLALLLALSVVPTGALASPADTSDLASYDKTMAGGFEYCGDIRPVFKNPDLQPHDDGFVHASGWFFIQFQIIAADPSFTVDRLTFSFGKPVPDALRSCDTPEWITDAYLKDYRVDEDPTDGFFIPINTSNVPDGEWAAAISVWQGDQEVGRAFTRAIVENGCPYGYRDPACPANIRNNDKVRPWPIVLPGDGEQIHGINGLTIEFAEPIQTGSVRATVNGERVPLTEMTPRDWDEDAVPAALDEDGPACPAPACVEQPWGPAFQWVGEIPEGAVISVQATDMSNNTVSKIMHLTSSAVGGVISIQLPKLEVKIPEATQNTGVGQTAEFEVTFVNVGKDTAHTDLHVEAAPELEVEWEPNHVVVPSGEEVTAILKARGTQAGTYEITAWSTYKAGTIDKRDEIPLTLTVGGSDAVKKANTTMDEPINTTEADTGDESNDSPGVGAIVVLGIVGVAALVGRRRRDA